MSFGPQKRERHTEGSRLHRLLAPWCVPCIAVAVALALAAGISALHRRAEKRREGEVLLARLQGSMNQLDAVEVQIAARPHIDPGTSANIEDLLTQIAALQTRLASSAPEEEPLREIAAFVKTYVRSLRSEITLRATDDNEQVRLASQTVTAPHYSRLMGSIDRAEEVFHDEAMQAQRAAQLDTTFALVATALLLGCLLGRHNRVRRTQAALTIEQAALRTSEQQFRSLIRNASDIIMILGVDGKTRYISPAGERILGYESSHLLRISAFEIVHSEDRERAQTLFRQVRTQAGNATSAWRLMHTDGSYRECEVILNSLLHEPGIEGILFTYRDVTERKVFEQQLAHQAFHDVLTDLPNRAIFMDRLTRSLKRAARRQSEVGVMFLDLDNFKTINDSLGHDAGDELLIGVAKRLQDCVRTSDTVARLGGDEFTVLLEDANEATRNEIAERILEQLRQPFVLQGREVFATASIGLAVSDCGTEEPEVLLRDADTAMYLAKTGGKANHVVFDSSMKEHDMERLELETDLRRALETDQLRVHYQPIIHLENERVCEVEALVRWQHPTRGLIDPIQFIQIAEETGLILPLGEWVLTQACLQAKAWQQQYPLVVPLSVSVNLSARQLQQPDVVERVAAVLAATGLAPDYLKLEITESTMMVGLNTVLLKLNQLRDLGIRIAVDDFGTGYSSISYLSTLPIDTLKVDRSFIQRLGQKSEDRAILQAIISLAKTLNLRVTSEGIESVEQLGALRDMLCDFGQGYYFSRPLTCDAMTALLASQSADISAAPILRAA